MYPHISKLEKLYGPKVATQKLDTLQLIRVSMGFSHVIIYGQINKDKLINIKCFSFFIKFRFLCRDIIMRTSQAACPLAIFPNARTSPSVLQKIIANIYAQWLPSSDYELIQASIFSFTKMNILTENCVYGGIGIPVRGK